MSQQIDRRTPAQKLLDINKRLEELGPIEVREVKEGHNQQVRRITKTRAILEHHHWKLTAELG